MADRDEAGSPYLLGCEIDASGQPRMNYRIEDITQHYPYDCTQTHCIQDEHRCLDTTCKKRLSERQASVGEKLDELEYTLHDLGEEFRALEQRLVDDWVELFRLVEGSSCILNNRDGCCDLAECISCRVEIRSRACVAMRMENALMREKIQTVKEYTELRLEGEEVAKTRRAKQLRLKQEKADEQLRLDQLRADQELELRQEKEEIEGLEQQVRHLAVDSKEQDTHLGERFHSAMERAEDVEDPVLRSIALAAADAYRNRLHRLLGFDVSGKSTLDIEREKIREA
ncbi:hypothetical protein LTR85_003656 [Meristemomyces frigidus]|nr:hypothetical protein LTR85_003656 [Meristemomyces frigidus]